MPMNIEAEKISPHFLSRFSSVIMPFRSLSPMSGTSQIPIIMLTVITAAIVTYCCAVSELTWPKVRPIVLSAFVAAIVS